MYDDAIFNKLLHSELLLYVSINKQLTSFQNSKTQIPYQEAVLCKPLSNCLR